MYLQDHGIDEESCYLVEESFFDVNLLLCTERNVGFQWFERRDQ
jgi:hypothetical protein